MISVRWRQVLPTWTDEIAPALRQGQAVLIVTHGVDDIIITFIIIVIIIIVIIVVVVVMVEPRALRQSQHVSLRVSGAEAISPEGCALQLKATKPQILDAKIFRSKVEKREEKRETEVK